MLEDGQTYEKTEIDKWLKSNNTSPLTREKLKTKKYSINFSIKNMVDLYLTKNPDKISEQYFILRPPKDYKNDEEVINFISCIKKYGSQYDKIIFNIINKSSTRSCLFLIDYIYENKLFDFLKIRNEINLTFNYAICIYQNAECVKTNVGNLW